MLLPSKELLSEVLGVEILDCKVVGNGIAYNAKDNYPTQSINIAELALIKCKEWALSKDYVVWSGSKYKLQGFDCCLYTNYNEIDQDFTADTETEAIFKSCEWIMEQTK